MNSYLSTLGPALANHLWQSTAFAIAAWLLTLALRSNQARVRHSVWLAASVKFLVPFSLLIAAGNLLPHPKQAVAPAVYSAMDVVEEPFAENALPTSTPVIPTLTMRERLKAILPACLAAIWLAGACIVFFLWTRRWRTVRPILKKARPADDGREFATLRRLEQCFASGKYAKPLSLRLSAERMEPGIFGIFHPVLVWPEPLSARLDDEHIEAIVAHELMHVRRRDNLTGALHMLVETVFWFHPLVWWMERQMVKEREQACDEAVVEMGGDAETYAEGLLKTCRFCIESPLACVAGVTGADLKRRVVEIVTGRSLLRMTWPRKLLLAAIAMCVVAAPVVLGQAKAAQRMANAIWKVAPAPLRTMAHAMIAEEQTPSTGLIAEMQADGQAPMGTATGAQGDDTLGPEFEVATIRPANRDDGRHWFGSRLDGSGGFTTSAQTLSGLVWLAYVGGPGKGKVSGGPKWADSLSDSFDINAKVDEALMSGWDKLSYAERMDRVRPMIRRLLSDRFHLKLRIETQPTPVYVLVQAKGGTRMKEVPAPDPVEGDPTEALAKWRADNPEKPMPGIIHCSGHTCTGVAVPMSNAIVQITGSSRADRIVIDETGLKGYYNFSFTQPGNNDESAMAEIEDDLGLKFEPRTVPMKTYIIDSAEKPSVDGAEIPEIETPSAGEIAEMQPPAGVEAPPAAAGTDAMALGSSFEVATIRPGDRNDGRRGFGVRAVGCVAAASRTARKNGICGKSTQSETRQRELAESWCFAGSLEDGPAVLSSLVC